MVRRQVTDTTWPLIRGSDWPLSEEKFVECLTSVCPDHTGFANRASIARKQAEGYLFVQDVGTIPDSRNFVLHFPCHQLHHGLCVTRDAAKFHIAGQIASDFEHWFTTHGA